MHHSPAHRAALAGGVAHGVAAVPPPAGAVGTARAPQRAGKSPVMPRAQVVALPAHTLMVVHPPARVRALSGTLWLTADGVGEDIVLEAGESRRFAEGGRVLAHALGGEALFEVCGATAARAGGPSGPVHRLLARLVRRLRRRPVPEAGA